MPLLILKHSAGVGRRARRAIAAAPLREFRDQRSPVGGDRSSPSASPCGCLAEFERVGPPLHPISPGWDTLRRYLAQLSQLQLPSGSGPTAAPRGIHRRNHCDVDDRLQVNRYLPLVAAPHPQHVRPTWDSDVAGSPTARVSCIAPRATDEARFGARDLRKVPSLQTDDLLETLESAPRRLRDALSFEMKAQT